MKRIILFLSLAFWVLNLSGQGFFKPVDTLLMFKEYSSRNINIKELSTGDFVIRNNIVTENHFDSQIVKANGDKISEFEQEYDLGSQIYYLDDQSFFIIGDEGIDEFANYLTVKRYDRNNNLLWSKSYPEPNSSSRGSGGSAISLADGFLIYGYYTEIENDTHHSFPYIFRIDYNGNIAWERIFEIDGIGSIFILSENHLSSYSIGNYNEKVDNIGVDTFSFITGRDKWEIAIDSDGNVDTINESKAYADLGEFDPFPFPFPQYSSFEEYNLSKIEVENGNIILSFINVDTNPVGVVTHTCLSKYNMNGDRIWILNTDDENLLNNERGFINKLPNGNILYIPKKIGSSLVEVNSVNGEVIRRANFEAQIPVPLNYVFEKDGYFMCVGSDAEKIVFFKIDYDLNVFDVETTYAPLRDSLVVRSVIETSNNEYAGVGILFNDFSEDYLYLFKADSNGLVFTNELNGNLYGDLNFDCINDTSDLMLADWDIIASGEQTFQATTKEDGSFFMQMDTGKYELSVMYRNDFWLNCDTSKIEFSNYFDTLTNIDLTTSAITPCSFIEVDVGIGRLRRCFSNQVVVQYCNQGTLAEEQAMIELHLDPYLDVDTTSIPIADQKDTTYFFDIGKVGIGECGKFTIHVTPNCDKTELEQEHCIAAHIFPDTLCVPQDSLWSGANVVVDAICQGDTTLLRIINDSNIATKDDLAYIVIVDDVIVSRGDLFMLEGGEIIELIVYEPGSSITILADQEPFHPSGNQVRATAFCAGTNFDFTSVFNQFDDDPFTDIVCVENIGSFDPNDKATIPEGVGPEHFIPAEEELEYKIRFQNTGTDTAFTVVIRDTISPMLDMSTFCEGIGSHDYVLEVDDNIITFTFNNILLPDSTVDWTASNGFVEFKISPLQNLVPGDIIENAAAIFFDFNEPVITNTVFHTIETPKVFSIDNIELCANEQYGELFFNMDTTITSSFFGEFQDSFSIVNINVLAVDSIQEFYTVPIGTLYEDVIINMDTVLTESLTNQMGCDSIITRIFMVERPNSTSSLNAELWDIYPNPTKDILHIHSNQFFKNNVHKIQLISTLGEIVLESDFEIVSGQTIDISLIDIPAGSYMLKIDSKNGFLIKKIIIQP